MLFTLTPEDNWWRAEIVDRWSPDSVGALPRTEWGETRSRFLTVLLHMLYIRQIRINKHEEIRYFNWSLAAEDSDVNCHGACHYLQPHCPSGCLSLNEHERVETSAQTLGWTKPLYFS